MKKGHILHNPNAGKGEYTKNELTAILESHKYRCGYSSTKSKNWKKDIKECNDVDFIVIGGGDGTVRKVVISFLADTPKEKIPPFVLLPLGTANNISRSLNNEGHPKQIISQLKNYKKKKFDTGIIKGLENKQFFLEGIGLGIFPQLMKNMKDKAPENFNTPEEELKAALKMMLEIVNNFKAEKLSIKVDKKDYSGHYIMAEVMNIVSIGPNINLSPGSNPSDGEFELVLIPESQRKELAAYIENKIKGEEKDYLPLIVKGTAITIRHQSKMMHIDDELIKTSKNNNINISINPVTTEFLVQ